VKARVSGIGAGLAGQVVDNTYFTERLDTSEEWILRRTGIRQRRWLGDGVSLGDLARQACLDALADAGCKPDEVDQVIVSTITPDLITPGLAPALITALGLREIPAVDVNAACAGFLYGLDQAAAQIESGRARHVLVCAAEALSRLTDLQDRSTAILFGDGAAAALVSAADDIDGWPPFVLGADGDKADVLFANTEDRKLRMSGQQVFRHAVPRMAAAMREALARGGHTVEDLDLVVAHQANARIIEAVATDLGVPSERLMVNVDRFANTSSATIPIALWEADRAGRLHPGSLVGVVAFGAGFVWGAGVVSWKEPAGVRA
jgi:3-oxoacyl-[acyl-carrier-protein] synthase-3